MRTVSTSPSSGSANTVRRPSPTKATEKANNPTPQEDNKYKDVQELSKRIVKRTKIDEDFAWLIASAIIDSHAGDIPRYSLDSVCNLTQTIKEAPGHYERGRFRLRSVARLAMGCVRIAALVTTETETPGRERCDLPISMLTLKMKS